MSFPSRAATAGVRASLVAVFIGLALAAVPAVALDPIRPSRCLRRRPAPSKPRPA